MHLRRAAEGGMEMVIVKRAPTAVP